MIDTTDLDLSTVSFTYGDSHPTFSDRVNDGKEAIHIRRDSPRDQEVWPSAGMEPGWEIRS